MAHRTTLEEERSARTPKAAKRPTRTSSLTGKPRRRPSRRRTPPFRMADRARLGYHWELQLPPGVVDPIYMCELAEKLHMTVQFITHDLGVISEISDNVLVMYGGQGCEKASTIELFRNPRHPYTAALIESRPRLGHRSNRLKTIEGSVPAPMDLPAGCPFQNRCPRAKSECLTLKPPMTKIGPDHEVACFNPL